ncbi:hypothetical protein L2688_07695 [Lactobacillus mulieris]|uniref:Uncharacterized protein n=1 Tax=Lactobacillus mulieris TaxID=2508708 RepID=A0AAW5WZF9_9LACO|nr:MULTISPECIES: hypothetical protein [Lactobacillus]DAU26672.1 MAG TPA: RUBREDOXIN REDUCTASE, RUBREDOXIN 2 DEGRADATION, IRON-SULFUR PROTEIN, OXIDOREDUCTASE [Caudoviricetes sp.]MCF1778164.1 hypothetical protein [Lactobacillus jensenii]MCZ3690740.1 hypothetical protein [Lactobacillus mulieris]MCZ3696698.1 hypothetical protein [Lactobacillus mulieris]MCZ3702600.1 hypothetical protein [Lactobacillus mulieris]
MTKFKCKKCGFDTTIEALLAIDCVIAIGMFFIGIFLKKYGYILGLVGIIFSMGILLWTQAERANRREIRNKLREVNYDKRR